MTEDADKKPPPKDRSNYRCWSCNEFVRLANSKQCPNYKKRSEDRDVNKNATWQEYEASMYVTVRLAEEEDEEQQEFTVNNAVHLTHTLEPTKVLLDNQADISIIQLMLLRDVQKSQRRIRVKRVGGPQLIVNEQGVLDGFFPVYASDKTIANVLSFADVEDLYDITNIRKRAFILHLSDRDPVFKRRQKLYVADWGTVGIVAATIQENESLYTKEEVNRAKLAYEFVQNSGYPSLGEVVHLITDGNIRNIPKLMPSDAERAYKIYGSHPEYLHGKMVKKTAARMPVDLTLRHVDKHLRLYTDKKCMIKSPTEAELIALMDNLGLLELFQEFVDYVTKKTTKTPVIYQDCNAVVMLVTKGGGKLRTKHLRARMNLGKEVVNEGRLKVVYQSAEGIEADSFSKPYDPAKRAPFAALIQGEKDKANQQVSAMHKTEDNESNNEVSEKGK
jgi:hypothetical protein